jgi:hypothetical protein
VHRSPLRFHLRAALRGRLRASSWASRPSSSGTWRRRC